MKCYTVYSASGENDTVRPPGADPAVRGCLAPGNVALSGAADIADDFGGVCAAADGPVPENLCVFPDAGASGLEDDGENWAKDQGLTPGDLGAPATHVEGGTTWTGHVECFSYAHGNDDPWNAAGTCDVDPADIAFETTDPCSEDECAELVPFCDDYTDLGNADIDSVSGNDIYSSVDLTWIDDVVRGNSGLIWVCDRGRYSLTDQEFFGLNTASFWRAVGVTNGDEHLALWEHDPDNNYARVGSIYEIDDAADGLTAFNALLGDEGDPMHITLRVTRNQVTKQIHIDAE